MIYEVLDIPDDLPPGDYPASIVEVTLDRMVLRYRPDLKKGDTLISFTKHEEITNVS